MDMVFFISLMSFMGMAFNPLKSAMTEDAETSVSESDTGQSQMLEQQRK
jgi:hypothetical protein